MVVPSYEVRVPALWGAAPRIVPLDPGSSRSSCSSSCSSCSGVPAVHPVAPRVRTFQAVPRCPGPLHTVDLSEVEEEATLAAMTVPAQSSNARSKKSSVIFSTKITEEQKHPMRASAEMEELQRENSRLMRSLQERTAQEKELERNARMQSIIFQRREQDFKLAFESAASRPAVEAHVREGATRGSLARQQHLKLPIRDCKVPIRPNPPGEVGLPEACASARSSRSSVSQPNLFHGVEADEDALGDDISWITPCLAEEECPRSRPLSAGSPSDLSTLTSRSAGSASSQAAGSTQRWMISLSKDEVEAAVKEAAKQELHAEEETPVASLGFQPKAVHDESRPVEDKNQDEDQESSHDLIEETPVSSLGFQPKAVHDESRPVEDKNQDEDQESSHDLIEETSVAPLEMAAEIEEAAEDPTSQDVDGESSDSDSDEDSSDSDSDTSESSDSSGSSTSSTDSEEKAPLAEPDNSLPEGVESKEEILLDTSPNFEAPEREDVQPELSATTLWRNKILGRGGEAPQRIGKSKALETIVTGPRRPELLPSSPPRPSAKRTLELCGTDALVSLRLSAKELAREKLKMLQQYRAESKGGSGVVSLPQLVEAKMSRVPESQIWEVSQVPQASHFAKLGKTRMPKQAQPNKGSKNGVKAMTQSRSLPSISTPSQFGIVTGAQRQILQARAPEPRSMDMRN